MGYPQSQGYVPRSGKADDVTAGSALATTLAGKASATVVTNIISGATPVGKASLADALTNGIAISDVSNLQDNLDTLQTNIDNTNGYTDTVAGTVNDILSGVQQVSTAQFAVADSLGNNINDYYLARDGTGAMAGTLDMANSNIGNILGIYVRTIYSFGSVNVFDFTNDDGSWSSGGGSVFCTVDGQIGATSFSAPEFIFNGSGDAIFADGSGTLANHNIEWDTDGVFGVSALRLRGTDDSLNQDGSGSLGTQGISWDTVGNLSTPNLYVGGVLRQTITTRTSSFSFNDNSLHVINSATATTATLPTSPFLGEEYELMNIGAGTCTITRAGSQTIFFDTGGSTTKTCVTGESIALIYIATNVWKVR